MGKLIGFVPIRWKHRKSTIVAVGGIRVNTARYYHFLHFSLPHFFLLLLTTPIEYFIPMLGA